MNQVQQLNSILENSAINPEHYKTVINGKPVDLFDIARAFKMTDPEQVTALRYLIRAHTKGDKIEQIDKAIQCLNRYKQNEMKDA